jgi:uncharacterized protein (UPF0335 family)
MSDEPIQAGQLKAITERILRLLGEIDDIKTDIKEIYAEAKANGFDKTILGKVVAHLRAEAKDPDKLAETETIFDLYLAAIKGASRTHTHVGAREAVPAKVEKPGLAVVPAAAAPEPAKAPEAAPESAAAPVEPPAAAPDTIPAAPAKSVLRPLCRNPDNCSGYGSTTCHACRSAAQVGEVAA